MLRNRTTLSQFLVEEQRRGHSHGDVNALLLDVAMACKTISRRVALGALLESREPTTESDAGPDAASDVVPDGVVKRSLADSACDWFIGATERGGQVTGMVSPAGEEPHLLPTATPKGKHLLVFEALEGAQSLDVNGSAGSIFSVLAAPSSWVDAAKKDYLQPGSLQVAAGYALYGPATILVLTLGRGVHGFTLDPTVGEFFLTHPGMTVGARRTSLPSTTPIDGSGSPQSDATSTSALPAPAGRGTVTSPCVGWIHSSPQTHRTLIHGGVCPPPLRPQGPAPRGSCACWTRRIPSACSLSRLADGQVPATRRSWTIHPVDADERVSFVVRIPQEVERIERYHQESYDEPDDRDLDLPLYASRGLFRTPSHTTPTQPDPIRPLRMGRLHDRQTSSAGHHRVVGGGYHVSPAHLRTDFSTRTGERRLRRGRQLSPMEPCGDEAHAMADAQARGDHTLSHFGDEANLFADLETLFRDYGATGGGQPRHYLHDETEAAPFGQEPGTFTPWEDVSARRRPAVLRGTCTARS